MEYRWKRAAQIARGLDAQQVGTRLESIRLENGHLTPDMVIADACHKKSPLHDGFTWDDTEAAQQHRRNEARYLLRSIVMVRQDAPDKEPIRAFVVVSDDEGVKEYTSTVVAMSDEALRRQVLARAMTELDAWRQRYEELSELAEIFTVIERTREAVAV